MPTQQSTQGQIFAAPPSINSIAEGHNAEALLRASQEFNRSLMDATPDCVKVLDLEGRLLYINTPGLCAMEIDDFSMVCGQEWEAAWPMAAWGDIHQSLKTARAGKLTSFQAYCPTAKGTPKWWEVTVSPVRDTPDGQIVRLLAMSRDISEHKKAEEGRDQLLQQLEAERGRLAEVFRQAPAFMCVVREPDHIFEMANDRYCQLVGRRNVLGRRVREVLPEFEAQGFIKVLDKVYQTGEPYIGSGIPVLLSQQPGHKPEQRYIDVVYQALRNATGAITGIVTVGVDVTDRKQAVDALRASQQFTRDVLNNLFAFVAVLLPDGTLMDANRAPLEAAAISVADVLGKKFWDCYWWSYSQEIQAQLQDWCNQAARGEIIRCDVQMRLAGNTRVWIDFQLAPLRDSEGEITHLIPSGLDISRRREAERTLRASEERYRTLFNSMDESYCVIEVLFDENDQANDYRFLEINPAFEKHTGLTGATGQTMRTLVPALETRWFEIYGQVVKTGEPVRFVDEAKAMGRWFDVYAFRLGEAGSHKVAILSNDISERKRTEAALNESEESLRQLAAELSEASNRKDEFLAMLAHELRNPLAPIRNGLQLMKLSEGQKEPIQQARAMMERQLTQLVRLIDDLMDVSRIRLGKLELRKERLQLAMVLSSAVETSRPLIEQMGHELIFTPPDSSVMVNADMTRLAQVFLNLLNNAAKYSERGSHIQVQVMLEEYEVLVTVSDTGIGIAADHLPHIFDMFTQVDGSLEKSQGGLGIGLTLVQRLVVMHGGSIEAKSEGPGKGSAFVVRLPLVMESSPAYSAGAEVEPTESNLSLRILIVDDNRDGADSLSEMLNLMGNDTRTAYDGQQGVELAEQYRPEVILLDIGMPKLNGYEACRLIRAKPWGKDIVLIAVTGWGQDKDRYRTHEAGFDHHLVKPVDPQSLMSILAHLHRQP